MQDSAPEIDPKQTALIVALLAGKTIEAAAGEVGINPSTAHRWLRDPAFAAELGAARREALRSALDVFTAGARAAAGEVLAILRDKKTPPYVRLRAAEITLERLHRWADLEDHEARLKALEEVANDKQAH